jgi:peptide/nickel transport system ATP-binding protein
MSTAEPGTREMRCLEVRELKTHFHTPDGVVRVLDGISFHVNQHEIVGLVGESGCGKSVTGLSIMQLVPPPGRVVGGEILFNGRDLFRLSEREMQAVRGAEIGMIFQNPQECLNPVVTIGKQLQLVYLAHRKLSRAEARQMGLESLRTLGLPQPKKVLASYPHELSGGMCQRVMIALAVASQPMLLIADEATTALDVTVQLQLLELLARLREEEGLAELVVSHDLGVIAELCDRAYVMYLGEIVESGPVQGIFQAPLHPYTQGLIGARPTVGSTAMPARIPGDVAEFSDLPMGCRFHPRCAHVQDRCRSARPTSVQLSSEHEVSCFLYEG